MPLEQDFSPAAKDIIKGMAHEGFDPRVPVPAFTAHISCGCGDCSAEVRTIEFLVVSEPATIKYLTYILKDELKRYGTYACKTPKGYLSDDNDNDKIVLALP